MVEFESRPAQQGAPLFRNHGDATNYEPLQEPGNWLTGATLPEYVLNPEVTRFKISEFNGGYDHGDAVRRLFNELHAQNYKTIDFDFGVRRMLVQPVKFREMSKDV